VRFDRPHPIRALRVAVETRSEDEKHGVAIIGLQKRDQRGVPGRPRLAARQTDLDHPPRTEQRHIGGRSTHVVPVGAALQEVNLALRKPCCFSARADRIGRLARQERLVAGDEVSAQQVLLEVRRERIGCELQMDFRE
jgi:hypothetical protein